jgi:uncharacterized protein (DUF488 family)
VTGPRGESRTTVFTVGHSTRSLEDFIAVLQAHGVEMVADIRTIPRSRHNPQFNRETLPGRLSEAGIGYAHFAGLGGLRRPMADSPNRGWKNDSFRGFADYMATEEFEKNIEELIRLAGSRITALLCAEAVPWRCHRSLVADAMVARGIPVEHILGAGRTSPHRITPWARVRGSKVLYPEETSPDY